MVFDLTSEQAMVGLRAMKAVASANGDFADTERALLESAAAALDLKVDVAALDPVSPEEAALALPDPLARQRLLQAMIVTSLIDGEASKDEIQTIERFAGALGVDEPRVKTLHHVLHGRLNLVRFDVLRRAALPRQVARQIYEEKGLFTMIKTMAKILVGHGDPDPELAWRYKQLGLLPEGTLGRAFWEHMTRCRFAFPGEPGGMLELTLHHDMTHVLCGYDTDPEGECQIAAFYAGYFGEDPFSFIFMVLVMFQLGVRITPVSTPARGKFDPEKVIRAMRRGARLNRDLTKGWNHWEVVEEPLVEVRRRYGILEA
jgi:tellurite resistance protein